MADEALIEAMQGARGRLATVARRSGRSVTALRALIEEDPIVRAAWLEEVDKAEFHKWALKRCQAAGREYDATSPLCESAAQLLARARRAERILRTAALQGETQRGGARRHPLTVEATECRRELRLVLAQLGLATDGRQEKKDPSQDDMDSLLHRDGRRRMKVL